MPQDEWQMVIYQKRNGFQTLIYSFDVLLPLAALLCWVLAHTTCKVNIEILTGKEWGLPILHVSTRFSPFWGRRSVTGVNCLNVVLLSQEAFKFLCFFLGNWLHCPIRRHHCHFLAPSNLLLGESQNSKGIAIRRKLWFP